MMYTYKKANLMILATLIAFATLGLVPTQAVAQYGLQLEDDTLTKSVLIHPVIKGETMSAEHEYRSKLHLGDQLARDFTVSQKTENGIVRRFKNDGHQNEDWYSWRKDVLAPLEGTVTRVQHPQKTNEPGIMNRDAEPGLIFFKNDKEVVIAYTHVREIKVQKGDHVKAGEVVARVGNNGNSRNPHLHVGAWENDTPLQIQVDLYAEQRD